VIREFDLLSVPQSVADVFIPVFPETLPSTSQIARELRQQGVKTDQSILTNRSLGDQLKYAGRRGIPLAVIVGSAELAQGNASIKDLKTGDQDDVALAVLGTAVRGMIERQRAHGLVQSRERQDG